VTAQEWVFVVLAIVGSLSAFRLVTTTNVVRGALYLVVTLATVGGTYLLMAAEFVAWVQVLIYVGAIVILFLFGLMLTKAPIGRSALDNQQRGIAFVIGVLILGGLVYLIQGAFPWGSSPKISPVAASGSTGAIGESMFSSYVLPFEAVSFLLLAALIGAIVLSRRDDRGEDRTARPGAVTRAERPRQPAPVGAAERPTAAGPSEERP
jgi:NADH-quinone oxidoreductase subunit J